MKNHDAEDRDQGFIAIGVLHDRYAEQDRIGKERTETDGDRLSRPPAEEESGEKDAGKEADKSAKVEPCQHSGLECLREIEIDHCPKQQGRHRKPDRECIEVVRQILTEVAGSYREPACGEHDEDGQNDDECGQQGKVTAVEDELSALRC